MRVTDAKLKAALIALLKDHLVLEVKAIPEFHSGAYTEDRYLCLMLGDERITSIKLDYNGSICHEEMRLD